MKRAGLALATAVSAFLVHAATAQNIELPDPGPDDLIFSLENMDTSVDPADDFLRFAAGGWLTRVQRPQEHASWGFATIQSERIKAQILALLEQVVADATTAPKGSVTQLVGDFWRAYMDTERRDAQGMAPLKGELDRIATIASIEDFANYAAHFELVTGQGLLLASGIIPDLADGTRKVTVFAGGDLGLKTERDVYRAAEDAPRRIAYRTFVNDLLRVAGYEEDVAARMADTVLAIETELDAAKLLDAETRDFTLVYNPMALSEVQAQIPQIDLARFITALGNPVPEQIMLIEPRYFPVLSRILNERPIEDFQDYAAYRLIRHFAPLLSTDFDGPERALNQTFKGVADLDPIEDRAIRILTLSLGHPLSQIYVQGAFRKETRAEIFALIDDILAAFRERIPTREWLSDQTKAEALAKLDAFRVAVGYPQEDEWIDYSALDIVPDDPVANAMAIVEFESRRIWADPEGPVVRDHFYGKSTYPIALNAAYSFGINGFEITAAIAQPPAYQPDAPAAVRYCGFGGIIGHESTHGFDTSGRQFDSKGNLRDWWSAASSTAFLAEAQKLVDQVAATELLPGVVGNGEYWLPENMADVGGIKLAHAALMRHLADYPEDDIEVGGYSQEQLCFIAWVQLWVETTTDEFLINVATSGNHPPHIYRTTAPLQHVDAFYDAFDIREGDPMWLPPEKRVRAW